MKTLFLLLASALLVCPQPTRAQDPASQKTSAPKTTFIIKVQDVQGRTASTFVDQINAIEGMTVKSHCKSKLKELWYVLIELDKHRHPSMEEALGELEKNNIVFKPLYRPESDFGTICDNN